MGFANEDILILWSLINWFNTDTNKKGGHEKLKTHTQPSNTYQRVGSLFKKKKKNTTIEPWKNSPLGWCSVSCCSDRDLLWKPLSINAYQCKDYCRAIYNYPSKITVEQLLHDRKPPGYKHQNLFPQYYWIINPARFLTFNAVYFGGYWGMEQNERKKKPLETHDACCVYELWRNNGAKRIQQC